jgi:hypothetical protein
LLRLLALLAGVLTVAGCTVGGVSDENPEGSTTLAGSESGVEPNAPSEIPLSEIPGRLVVLDTDGNVVTVRPDGSDPTAVTDDGGASASYSQPSWSPQSDRIAWAEIASSGFGVGISGPDGEDRTTVPMSAPPFFLYWSPDGKGMGVLHNGLEGAIEFELIDVESASASIVGSGTPFYFSWSPDSDRVVVHVQRDIFGIIDLDGGTTDLGATGGDYQSPHWTPSGIFHLGVDGLEVRDPAGESVILATVPGSIALVANRQGTQVALQSFVPGDEGGISVALTETPALPANAVVVVDAATGTVHEVTDGPSIGLFWSPDGESLLVLEPTGTDAEVDVVVWKEGTSRTLFSIAPQSSFLREVLQFFDQYSQSLQLWSPDSSAVVLVGAVDGDQGIWVQSVESDSPVKVFEGTWAAWSNG